jgi:hypothetical protein
LVVRRSWWWRRAGNKQKKRKQKKRIAQIKATTKKACKVHVFMGKKKWMRVGFVIWECERGMVRRMSLCLISFGWCDAMRCDDEKRGGTKNRTKEEQKGSSKNVCKGERRKWNLDVTNRQCLDHLGCI